MDLVASRGFVGVRPAAHVDVARPPLPPRASNQRSDSFSLRIGNDSSDAGVRESACRRGLLGHLTRSGPAHRADSRLAGHSGARLRYYLFLYIHMWTEMVHSLHRWESSLHTVVTQIYEYYI